MCEIIKYLESALAINGMYRNSEVIFIADF